MTMHWVAELLLELLLWPFTREEPASRVGESRLDREARRLWQIVAVIIAALALGAYLYMSRG